MLSRHGHGPAAAPTADTTASVRESVRWHPVAHGDARGEGLPHRRPPRTKYNRSVVAPPVSTAERIGQWIVVGLVVLTIILIAVATIQNRFGSLTSVLGAGTHVIEEVRTWLNPWTTV